jgi:hypothetical protein
MASITLSIEDSFQVQSGQEISVPIILIEGCAFTDFTFSIPSVDVEFSVPGIDVDFAIPSTGFKIVQPSMELELDKPDAGIGLRAQIPSEEM